MRAARLAVLALILFAASTPAAWAQRFPFERTIPASGPATLDVSTVRGTIEVVAIDGGSIVVAGEATVRIGFKVPANAVELAKRVAADPPVSQEGSTVKLRPPTDSATQQAVTLSYRVQVPRGTVVRTHSDSGATSIRGVAGTVDVQTQSAEIDLGSLGGATTIVTGSGTVRVDGVAGPLNVTTSSSGCTATNVGSSLHVHTQSGEVTASLTGTGDVDVQTSSSAIKLDGVRGGLLARTQSGRITVAGVPGKDWTITTSSSAVSLDVGPNAAFVVDASSRSGSVEVSAGQVKGATSPRTVQGTVGAGGPTLRVRTGSGAIRILPGAF